MAREPRLKKHLDSFVASRADANRVFSSPLVSDAADIRRLDKHVKEFMELLRKDAGEHEVEALKKHAKEFEEELHDELEYLFLATRQDLELYQRILKALSDYRKELRKISGEVDMKFLASSELNYADLLLRSAHEKLDTLALLFKKLRQ
ncbi:MAG: hypothetical protein ACLFO2_00965 [Candidatus Woesearchaeota archaeon]